MNNFDRIYKIYKIYRIKNILRINIMKPLFIQRLPLILKILSIL